tara:strand:- start:2358 stop:3269 length:912 start_codon:yes stop_codon:yes gene_type:complete
MKKILSEVIKLLKEYTEPPAKSQQQWKLFSIVKDVQKNNRKAPPWVGRGKNKDKQMISMMANKIPSGEVDKFLNVDINSLPVYVDGESSNPGIDKIYKAGQKAKGKSTKASGPSSSMKDKPGGKKGKGRPEKIQRYNKGKTTNRMINKALKSVGDLRKSKSPVAKSLRKRGFNHTHQKAAKKHGDWTRTESLKSIRNIIVEEIKEAMSSTERMRRYNKRHPEKVKQNLKKTQDDRVARNKAHNDKTKEYGTELMRNKDVHHPNGTKNGNEKIVNKDHGRDKKNEAISLLKGKIKKTIINEINK